MDAPRTRRSTGAADRGACRSQEKLGTRFRRLYREQYRGHADAARGLREAEDRPTGVRLELVGVRRPRGHADARRRAPAAGVAVRGVEAGRRTAVLPLL